MAFDFPNAPTTGQTYPATPVPGQPTYTWDGEKWVGTVAGPATTLPLMDGVAAVGVSVNYTPADHVHPSDTSRAPVNNPTFTGTVKLPGAPASALEAATKAYVDATTPTGFLPLTGGNMTGNIGLNASGQISAGGPLVSMLVNNASGSNNAGISFVVNGVFGANFGMANDGNFYMGGWSYGANVAYRFWTTRDGSMITNVRLAMLADVAIASATGLTEPYGGGVITGSTGIDMYNNHTLRFRQLQVFLNGAWGAVGYA